METDGQSTAGLDGVWRVVRTGDLLPPLVGMRKIIHGSRGATKLWRLPSLPFRIDGCLLRYDRPLGGFVDELEPLGEGYAGRAMFRGRELGRFRLERLRRKPPCFARQAG